MLSLQITGQPFKVTPSFDSNEVNDRISSETLAKARNSDSTEALRPLFAS